MIESNEVGSKKRVIDIQADQFARALLMPEEFITKDLKEFIVMKYPKSPFDYLSDLYKVPVEHVVIRLYELNLV